MHQRACEHEALGHASRIAHHLVFPAVTKAEFLEQRVCARLSFFARHPVITCMKSEDLTCPQAAVKIALLGYNGDTLLDAHGVRNYVDAHNACRTTCGKDACGQHANGRRLTSPVWS